MALIALEFEDDHIFVASGRAAGKRTQIQNLFSIDIEGSDEQVAALLKSELAKRGLRGADAIVVVSRSNAEVRLMEVPPSPDNELPDIVRFVARNEFASLNDNWLLDYTRLTGDQASTGQVLAAGVSPEMSNQIKTIVEAAGLRLKHMVLRPFAAVDLMSESMVPNTVHLLVDPNNGQTDLTIVDGHDVVATRTVRISSESESADKLVPEIRRTIASSSRALGGKPVNQIIVFGDADQNETLGEKLRSRMDSDVTFVAPLKHPVVNRKVGDVEHPTRYVALMGALVRQASNQRHTIDFLNPRRAKSTKTDLSKLYLYGSVAAAAVIVTCVLGWWTLRSLDQEVAELEKEVKFLQDLNEGKGQRPAVKKTLAEVGKIDDWKTAEINWQEKLFGYSQKALTADKAIVDNFSATGPSTRSEGRISITTRSSGFETEKQLVNSLSDLFIVTPGNSEDIKETEYPILSSLRIEIKRPEDAIEAIDKLADDMIDRRAAQRNEAPEQPPEEPSTEP